VAEPACPRCDYPETERLAESPVPGVWEVRGCPRCRYSWRSTEPPANSSREHYPARFRMTPDGIAAARAVPPVG
jgi:vanillate/4-hydroxybenzoate decarboxylase subunit D